nr:hypothetical protein [Tanacetum cinerariifolium]
MLDFMHVMILGESMCFSQKSSKWQSTFSSHPTLTSLEVKDDVFDHDQVLKPLFPSPIPVEDIDSFLEKSDTSLSLPKYETFLDHTEETNSGSTTTHADYSLPKHDLFLFEIEPDQGKLTSIVMKDHLAEPRVHVPNVLTTHPTLILDLKFIPFDNSLPEFETFYFDIEEKNSGCTTIHADISLLDLESFNFDFKPDPSESTSIVDFGIYEDILSITNVNLPPEEDHSPLFTYVVWIFIYFLKYQMVPPHLFSFGNKDTIFDPGIVNYHFPSLLLDVSHRGYKYHPLHITTYPLDQIRTDLSYAEEPEAIIDRQDIIMRKEIIPFVKILWKNHPEREATWETEESIRTSYPHFLP